jgi:hypothetical protein
MAAGRSQYWHSPGTWLIVASVALAVITVVVSTQREPSKLAIGLLQGITLVFGTVGSFVLGKDASREAAQALIRPHARSAFRRVQNLYRALGRQQQAIRDEQYRLANLRGQSGGETVIFEQARASLATLEYMVVEQISTADDALEDWRDLVPDEVAAIEAEGRKREESDGNEA